MQSLLSRADFKCIPDPQGSSDWVAIRKTTGRIAVRARTDYQLRNRLRDHIEAQNELDKPPDRFTKIVLTTQRRKGVRFFKKYKV
jgi:hypothetical protein